MGVHNNKSLSFKTTIKISILWKLASLRDPSRYAARRALRARDTRCTHVAGLVARGGLAAAPPPQLTRNGATAPLLRPHGVATRPRADYSLREFPHYGNSRPQTESIIPSFIIRCLKMVVILIANLTYIIIGQPKSTFEHHNHNNA